MNLPNLSSEINNYIESNSGISYYDLLAFAYDNDRTDWIDALRYAHTKEAVSEYLRNKRLEDGYLLYDLEQARKKCSIAEVDFKKRHRAS